MTSVIYAKPQIRASSVQASGSQGPISLLNMETPIPNPTNNDEVTFNSAVSAYNQAATAFNSAAMLYNNSLGSGMPSPIPLVPLAQPLSGTQDQAGTTYNAAVSSYNVCAGVYNKAIAAYDASLAPPVHDPVAAIATEPTVSDSSAAGTVLNKVIADYNQCVSNVNSAITTYNSQL